MMGGGSGTSSIAVFVGAVGTDADGPPVATDFGGSEEPLVNFQMTIPPTPSKRTRARAMYIPLLLPDAGGFCDGDGLMESGEYTDKKKAWCRRRTACPSGETIARAPEYHALHARGSRALRSARRGARPAR